jgi:cation diffusion facilitator family transporter
MLMDLTEPHETNVHLDRRADQETRLIRKVALYAFLLNLGLAVMKVILALFSNSLAVTAGAIDSGTDAVSSLVLYGGLRLSTRKTPSFPLGLYKIENFISVMVAFFIFFGGYEIARQALSATKSAPELSITVVILLGAGTLGIYLFGLYATRVGRTTGSPTLVAEGKHRQVDVVSSVVVLLSVMMSYLGWEFSLLGISIDRLAAGVVLIFIAWTGWELLTDGMRVLLDASIDFQTLDQVRSILEHHPMVVKVQSLIGRNAGRYRFLMVNVVMRTDDLQKAHQISQSLESEIREKIPHVEKVMVHYEPQLRTHTRIAIPLADPSRKMSAHFGVSPYFALVTVRLSDHHVEKEEVVKNPHKDVETAKGIRVAEWLVAQKVDHVMMSEDLSAKGPGYVLSNAGVQSTVTAASNVEEAIEEAVSVHKTQ